MNKHIVLQQQTNTIYELDLPDINPDEVAVSIKNFITKFPRLESVVDDTDNYTTFQKDDTGRIFYKKSSGYIPDFHTMHSPKIDRHHNNVSNFIEENDKVVFDKLMLSIEKKIYELCKSNDNIFEFFRIYPEILDYWCAVYQKGDRTEWHTHGERVCFNCVYYACVEDDTPIIIENINNQQNLSITPKKGMLVAFPGQTRHMVPTLTSGKERIIFTASLVYKGKQ